MKYADVVEDLLEPGGPLTRSLGSRWNQSAGRTLYLRASDEEKAAALDAAIAWEDRGEDRIDTRDPKDLRDLRDVPERTRTMGPNTDETAMAPVDELVVLGARMKADKARLVELCRMIAGAPAEPVPMRSGVGTPTRSGASTRRIAARAPRKKREPAAGGEKKYRRAAAPGSPEYWKKVTCLECGAETGSRVYEGERYPVLHKDATTGETCKGSFAAVPEKG